jgi:hypothetical protein
MSIGANDSCVKPVISAPGMALAPAIPAAAHPGPGASQDRVLFMSRNRERAATLHRIFTCVDRARAKGKSLRRALWRPSWAWNGEPFRCDPSRRMRFSQTTLRALYYIWRRGGKNPEAVLLRCHEPRARISQEMLGDFVHLLRVPGVGSSKEAYRGLREWYWQELKVQQLEDLPSRSAFEEAGRGPIRESMRREARAELELHLAREHLTLTLGGPERGS